MSMNVSMSLIANQSECMNVIIILSLCMSLIVNQSKYMPSEYMIVGLTMTMSEYEFECECELEYKPD